MSLFAADTTTPAPPSAPPSTSWLPSWLQPVPTPPNGVVLSADYDGCFDILFYLGDLLTWKRGVWNNKTMEDSIPRYKGQPFVTSARDELEKLVANATEFCDEVILYCGSARQGLKNDLYNKLKCPYYKYLEMAVWKKEHPHNGFGLATIDYVHYVEDKNKELGQPVWKLNRLLLGDVDNNKERGTAWGNPNLSERPRSIDFETLGGDRKLSDLKLKIDIVQVQLNDIHQNSQNVSDYWFFDDRSDILTVLWEALNGGWQPVDGAAFANNVGVLGEDGSRKVFIRTHGVNVHLVRFSSMDVATRDELSWKEDGEPQMFTVDFHPENIPLDIRQRVLRPSSRFYTSIKYF